MNMPRAATAIRSSDLSLGGLGGLVTDSFKGHRAPTACSAIAIRARLTN